MSTSFGLVLVHQVRPKKGVRAGAAFAGNAWLFAMRNGGKIEDRQQPIDEVCR
ncbi:MAG: hypothetical protein MUE50_15445 [Pirellulaceae bacterium]|nr:hypothetical protein [Pirellulaceae bacterium]